MNMQMNIGPDKSLSNGVGTCTMYIEQDKLSYMTLPVSVYINNQICLKVTSFINPAGLISVPQWVISKFKFNTYEDFYPCTFVYPDIATKLILKKVDDTDTTLNQIKEHIEACGVVNIGSTFQGFEVYQIYTEKGTVSYAYTKSELFVDNSLTLEIFNEDNPISEYIKETNTKLLKCLKY